MSLAARRAGRKSMTDTPIPRPVDPQVHRAALLLNGTWQLLDRSPKGRDDGEPRDWPRRHDEYPEQA